MRVTFIISSLQLGGAERSLVKTITAINEYADQIELVVLSKIDDGVVSELPANIRVHLIPASTSASPWLWLRLRRVLSKSRPDVVVGWSTYANLVTILATRCLPIGRTVVSERNYIPRIFGNGRISVPRRRILIWLIRTLYARADIVAANSLKSLRFLSKFIGSGPTYAYLPNSIDVDLVCEKARQKPEIVPVFVTGPRILAVGRLDRQKGFDVLIEALALLRNRFPWQLVLVGDGEERDSLERLARSLGVEQAIQWIGLVKNPFPYYVWADLVIVPSRFEGFPNVAMEAMSVGRTVICANCQTGPAELTLQGKYGVLVKTEDPRSLVEAIIKWSEDEDGRTMVAAMAQKHIRTTYDARIVKERLANTLCSIN
jgi:GalNAc-alpha-(1->4)-GalNAc-alpha-(1->3)-diNAcBac-PP-undecaprenol alpha-1,4-N-acetyl-D-galactosaminyltransferase